MNHPNARGPRYRQLPLWRDAQRLLLQVEDQGPGIPAEDLERVFERFYSRGTVQGAGLGLAIVERVMRAHGGRLDLLPREGGGLRAILRLPGSGNASVRARMQSAHPGGQ